MKDLVIVIMSFLLLSSLCTFAQAVDNCATYEGSPYDIGWTTTTSSLTCCYEANPQGYYKEIQGINYSTHYDATCGEEAPCEGVPIEAEYGDHIAKFAWRYDAYAYGNCPNYPATRWRNLAYNGGLIHASDNVGLFDDAGL